MFVYAAGTTTFQAAFVDSSGDTALPNPIILNVRGEVAPSAIGTSCGLWLDPTLAYKFVLAPATDSNPPTDPFWTVDDIVSSQSAILAALAEYEATLGGVPIGSMTAFPGSVIPNGWLLCYGQAVSRTAYAFLFAVIGIAFGSGDSSTTFNLPDLRGRYPSGADNMGGVAANRVTSAVSGINAGVVGTAGGSQLSQADTITATTTISISDPTHVHTLPGNTVSASPGFSGGSQFGYAGTTTNAASTGISATASTEVTSSLTGSSQNMPPTQVVNWMIYTGISS